MEEEPEGNAKKKQPRESEGRRTVPWIWMVIGADSEKHPIMQEALRIEWCKTRARAERWREEIILLREEMRRVIAFLKWRETDWLQRVKAGSEVPAELKRGMDAYARRQADVMRRIYERCESRWVSAGFRLELDKEARK